MSDLRKPEAVQQIYHLLGAYGLNLTKLNKVEANDLLRAIQAKLGRPT